MEAKERILIKANELFNRFGFKRVTMDEIAVKTGMSKKTIYQTFSNKDEIINSIVELHICNNSELCLANIKNAENAVHEVFLNMNIVERMSEDVNPGLLEDLEKYYPAIYDKIYRHKHGFIAEKIKENLEKGIAEGVYRDDIDIDVITKLRIETMFVPFNQQLFPFSKYNLCSVEMEIINHFLHGIATLKGIKLIQKYNQIRNNK